MGPCSPAPWITGQGPAGFRNHLQCLHFSQGGEWAWQEGKRGLKGNAEQLFSIFPEEKEEEIDLQQASRGIYAKYREVFLNVLTFRMDL